MFFLTPLCIPLMSAAFFFFADARAPRADVRLFALIFFDRNSQSAFDAGSQTDGFVTAVAHEPIIAIAPNFSA